MTLIALISQASDMQRIVVAAHATLCRRASVFVVYVTLDALNVFVSLVERPGSAKTVHRFDAGGTDLF